MCLKIDSTKTKPKPGNIRWKFLDRNLVTGQITSPAYTGYVWNPVNEVNSSLCVGDRVELQSGFHVFTNKEYAEEASKQWLNFSRTEKVVVKLRVDDFKCSGLVHNCDPYSDGKYGEVWGRATILEVYVSKHQS